MEKYQQVAYKNNPTMSTYLKIDSVTDEPWNHLTEFVDYIEEAGVQYQHVKGLRQAFRKFSKRAASARCFTAFLPTQSTYASVLCGGSIIILEVSHDDKYSSLFTTYDNRLQINWTGLGSKFSSVWKTFPIFSAIWKKL